MPDPYASPWLTADPTHRVSGVQGPSGEGSATHWIRHNRKRFRKPHRISNLRTHLRRYCVHAPVSGCKGTRRRNFRIADNTVIVHRAVFHCDGNHTLCDTHHIRPRCPVALSGIRSLNSGPLPLVGWRAFFAPLNLDFSSGEAQNAGHTEEAARCPRRFSRTKRTRMAASIQSAGVALKLWPQRN